jgi:hypothetical protein
MKNLALATAASLAAAISVIPASAHAAVLVIENGVLLGANGVDVNGSNYNVLFATGTCANLFTGCDEQFDFAFNTAGDALAASIALRDQVFIGAFDTDPTKTVNCTSGTCYFYTPFGIINNQVQTHYYGNDTRIGSGPLSYNLGLLPDYDLVPIGNRNYAIFSIGAVPEPATWAFMIFGFGAIGGAMRRQRKANVKVSYV